jgi:hypothetical protein
MCRQQLAEHVGMLVLALGFALLVLAGSLLPSTPLTELFGVLRGVLPGMPYTPVRRRRG